jgi:hypothetical protein
MNPDNKATILKLDNLVKQTGDFFPLGSGPGQREKIFAAGDDFPAFGQGKEEDFSRK